MPEHKIYSMPVSSVYPHYVNKVVKKGRTESELLAVITWLTGYSETDITTILDTNVSFRTFFEQAPQLHPNRYLITGVICKIRVETIEDPLMQNIRYLDKLVDELAKGKSLDKILRKPQ